MKAHSRLSESCSTLSMPVSLEEIVKAWDASARAVLCWLSVPVALEAGSSLPKTGHGKLMAVNPDLIERNDKRNKGTTDLQFQ